jgi:maltose alpha-D-glucosyltransferase/alpha-amylase
MLTLPGHGFYAFRLSTDAPVPEWHEEKLASRELPVLVLVEGLRTFFDDQSTAKGVRQMIASRTREQLQRQVLLPHLLNRRWFAAKGQRITRIEIIDEGEWTTSEGSWLLTFLEVQIADAPSQLYFLPLGAAWEERGADPLQQYGPWTLARVRQKEKMGILYGAFGDARFCRALARAMGDPKEMPFADGRLRFASTSAYAQFADGINEDVKHPSLEQSNTGVMFGNKLYLKGYRRLRTGINPEVEVGRFLTETSPFPNVAPVLGWIEYVRADGEVVALALLQPYVENQGSAWTLTQDYLQRITQRLFTPVEAPAETPAQDVQLHGFFLAMAHRLGQRVGELHAAFAKPADDPAFAPEPVSADEVAQWVQRIHDDAGTTLDLLSHQLECLPEAQREPAEALLAHGATLLERLQRTVLKAPDFVKTRYHGDLHLGQVLLTGQDFLIVDFEGEPARPLQERRAKHSPLRDVAGMLRSLDYAAALAVQNNHEQPAEKRGAVEKAIRTWQAESTQAFVAGYRQASADLPSLPHDAQTWQQLLELFLIEKALYELRYEINMRPDWVGVPLRGLLALVQTRAVDAGDAG